MLCGALPSSLTRARSWCGAHEDKKDVDPCIHCVVGKWQVATQMRVLGSREQDRVVSPSVMSRPGTGRPRSPKQVQEEVGEGGRGGGGWGGVLILP